MRIGVFGGSFQPPHVGHALVAGWLLWTERVDAVWIVPTFAHAFGKRLAPYGARLRWCEALAGTVGPGVVVSDVERRLGGTSWSVRTLDALSAEHPGWRFRWVIGTDLLEGLPRWKEADRLQATYPPIVVGRSGHGGVDGVPTFPAVSSTAVRDRLVRGEAVDGLVPAPVLRAMGPDPGRWFRGGG